MRHLCLLLLTCAYAACVQAATAKQPPEPLFILGVGDYHLNYTTHMDTFAYLRDLLRAGGHPAYIFKAGQVHSNIDDEWEKRGDSRRGSQRWITGETTATEPSKIAELERRIAAGPPKEPEGDDPERAKAYRKECGRYSKLPDQLAAAKLAGRKPDIVIVSAGSNVGFDYRRDPNKWRKDLVPAVGNFKQLIEDNGARMILHGTMRWGPRTKPESIPEKARAMAASYREVLAETPVDFVPAFVAFAKAYASSDELGPFTGCKDEAGHYDARSAYLYACCLYVAITGASPEGLPVPAVTYRIPDRNEEKSNRWQTAPLTAEQGAVLQRLAWEAHREWLGK